MNLSSIGIDFIVIIRGREFKCRRTFILLFKSCDESLIVLKIVLAYKLSNTLTLELDFKKNLKFLVFSFMSSKFPLNN